MECGGTAPYILNPGTRSRWVIGVTAGRFALSTRWRRGWVNPKTDWKNWKKRIILALTGNRTTVPRLFTQYPWHHTTHAVQDPDLSCSCIQRRRLWGLRCSSILAWHDFRPTQVYEGPRDPVERGLVEPKDGLDMNKNPPSLPRIEPLHRIIPSSLY